MSLQYRKPINVVTTANGLLWTVNEGRIFLDTKPESPASPNAP